MKQIGTLILALISVFAPAQAVITSVLVLCLADLAFGVLAARKRGEPITSTGLKRTVLKLFVYESAILLGFLTQTYLMTSLVPVMSLISSIIGATEMKSILESLDEISGGSFFSSVVSKLGNIVSQTKSDK